MTEQWRSVPGYEGFYEVSDMGRVRSLDRVVPHAWSGHQRVRGRVMATPLDRKGYPRLLLKRDGKFKSWAVHRLVMVAFRPRHDSADMDVNHIDGDKARSVLSNLEWCTASENRKHSYSVLGTPNPMAGKRGGLHHNSKRVIGTSLATGESRAYASCADAAADGFTPRDVAACARGAQKSHRGFAWTFVDQREAVR